uniref:UM005_0337.1 n=1 Tax=Ulva compressa TaxID=63659 RepID=A0A8J9X9U9_ULVCO|nr:UM005_0337.1 [Ulva compressa]|eukprot:jgi/Ulvmu1/9237/UM005_0337.1
MMQITSTEQQDRPVSATVRTWHRSETPAGALLIHTNSPSQPHRALSQLHLPSRHVRGVRCQWNPKHGCHVARTRVWRPRSAPCRRLRLDKGADYADTTGRSPVVSRVTASHLQSRFAALQKEEFLSKWQSNLAKHEGQLEAMQQTLLQYIHAHDAILGDSESTAYHRLLASACERVLAPLKVRNQHSYESSSGDETAPASEEQPTTSDSDGPLRHVQHAPEARPWMLRADGCWANSAAVWRDETSASLRHGEYASRSEAGSASGGPAAAAGWPIAELPAAVSVSRCGLQSANDAVGPLAQPAPAVTAAADKPAAGPAIGSARSSAGRQGSARQDAVWDRQWEVVQTDDGADAVAVGRDIVPLDVVSAGQMPGLAARLRVDTQAAWLQSLYSQQLHLLSLANHCHGPPHAEERAAATAAAVPRPPQVAAAEPEAALALEQEVAERALRQVDLDLRAARLTDNQAAALALLLPCFTAGLDRLCIAGSLMTDTGGAGLMAALEACPWRPRRLDLSGNTSCAARFASGLARCLQKRVTGAALCEISLARTPIGNKGAVALAAALAEVPALRQLELCECGIEDAGAAGMHAVLVTCPRLEELDMSWNLLGGAACASLVAALPSAECLRALRLQHSGISDADGALVCHALALCPRWCTVDLSGNQLRVATALVVADLLQRLFLQDINAALDEACRRQRNMGRHGQHARTGSCGAAAMPASPPRSIILTANPLGMPGARVLWKTLLALYTFHSRLGAAQALQRGLASQQFTRADLCSPAPAPLRHAVPATADAPELPPPWLQELCAVSSRRLAPLALRCDALQEHESLQRQVREQRGCLGLQPAESLVPPRSSTPLQPSQVAPCAAASACSEADVEASNPALSGLSESLASLKPLNAVITNCALVEAPHRVRDKHALHVTLADALEESRLLRQKFKQELKEKLDLSGKAKKKSGGAPADKGKVGKKKRKGKKKGKAGEGAAPLKTVDISAFDVADMSGHYQLHLGVPAAAQVVREVVQAREEFPGSVQVDAITINNRPALLPDLHAAVQAAAELAPRKHSHSPSAASLPPPTQRETMTGASAGAKAASAANVGGGEAGGSIVSFQVATVPVLRSTSVHAMSSDAFEYVIRVMSDPEAREAWKLQMVALVLAGSCVSPKQAQRLLGIFNPKVSEQEVDRAAVMLGAALADPLDYWLDVLPLLQPSARSDMLNAVTLMGRLDLGNPTGRYTFSCSSGVQRAQLLRLQLLASAEQAHMAARDPASAVILQPWRNLALNGARVMPQLLTDLRRLAMPRSGTVTLDYVSHTHMAAPQRSVPGAVAGCTPAALEAVLQELKAHSDQYVAELLALRADLLPMGRRGKDVEDAKDGLRIRAKRYDTQGELRAYGLRSMTEEQKEKLYDRLARRIGVADWRAGTGLDARALCAQHGVAWNGPQAEEQSQRRPPSGKAGSGVRVRKGLVKGGGAKQSGRSASKSGAAAGPGSTGDMLAAVLVEQAAVRVLCEPDPEAAVRAFFRLPSKMQRPVLLVVAGLPSGCAGVAALLSVMSPIQACRFMVCMYAEGEPQMLPEALRQEVRGALAGQVLHCCDAAGDHISRARRRRDHDVRASLAAVASGFTFTTAQASCILACLSYSSRNQVDALVILWGRLADRAAMGAVLPTLQPQQLDALLARLGHLHVLSSVDPPFGCRLRFEIIGNPEQEAAAKLLCKSATEAQQVWRHLVLEAKMRANAAAQAAAAEAARSHAGGAKPTVGDRRVATRAAEEAEVAQPPAWRALHPGLAVLTALEEVEEVVLSNIVVDGAPLVGRARLQLQHLWRDIAGRCCTLQVDYMPRPQTRLQHMHRAARFIGRLWRDSRNPALLAWKATGAAAPLLAREEAQDAADEDRADGQA